MSHLSTSSAVNMAQVIDVTMGCSGREKERGRVSCFSFEAFRSLKGEIGTTTSINDSQVFLHACGCSGDNSGGFRGMVEGGHR